MADVHGPIVIVDDDPSDRDAIEAAIAELGVPNRIVSFSGGEAALTYLLDVKEQPLVILSDVHMAGMDGFTLLQKIYASEVLRKKAIPFVFFTGLATPELINRAYDIGVQGYYKKAAKYVLLKDQLFSILSYWTRSLHPKRNHQG